MYKISMALTIAAMMLVAAVPAFAAGRDGGGRSMSHRRFHATASRGHDWRGGYHRAPGLHIHL
jgi:hypothetical protein